MFGLFFDFLLDEMLDDLKIYDLLRHFQTTWIEGLSTGWKAPGTPSFLLPGTASTFDRSIAQLNRTNKFVEVRRGTRSLLEMLVTGRFPPTLLGSNQPRGRRHTWTRTMPPPSSSTDRIATMVFSLSTLKC